MRKGRRMAGVEPPRVEVHLWRGKEREGGTLKAYPTKQIRMFKSLRGLLAFGCKRVCHATCMSTFPPLLLARLNVSFILRLGHVTRITPCAGC